MTRTCLKFELWPAADREMWASLVNPGHILDGAGRGSRWRPASRKRFQRDYGYWLSFLVESRVDLQIPPAMRATPQRVRDYLRTMADLSPTTRAMRVEGLSIIIRSAAPEIDMEWLREAQRRLYVIAKREPIKAKRLRVVASNMLYVAGIGLMEKACEIDRLPSSRAMDFRDGLMIALLALRPLRLTNYAGLRVGVHLHETSTGYRIDIPGSETKSGRPIELPVPDTLVVRMRCYLREHRRLLVGQPASDYLWINRSKRCFTPGHLSQHIAKLTERLVGVRVNPHLFRDCAATTIATIDPTHVRIIPAILGHADLATSERHYNHARTLEAGRCYQAVIRQVRAEARPVRRRTGRELP
jgi:integrase/recombinase XerD